MSFGRDLPQDHKYNTVINSFCGLLRYRNGALSGRLPPPAHAKKGSDAVQRLLARLPSADDGGSGVFRDEVALRFLGFIKCAAACGTMQSGGGTWEWPEFLARASRALAAPLDAEALARAANSGGPPPPVIFEINYKATVMVGCARLGGARPNNLFSELTADRGPRNPLAPLASRSIAALLAAPPPGLYDDIGGAAAWAELYASLPARGWPPPAEY